MDDYLDVYGDSSKTGKQIGGDILSNKKTFLSTKAHQLADTSEQSEFISLLSTAEINKVKDVVSFYDRKNIREITLAEINHYSDHAFELLEKAPILSKRKVHLKSLAESLLNREY